MILSSYLFSDVVPRDWKFKKYESCKYTTKWGEHNSKRFHVQECLYLFVLAMGTGHVRLSGALLNSFGHLILSIHLRISLQKFFSIPLQQGHRGTLVTAPLPVGDRFPVGKQDFAGEWKVQ